jgi:hypothetical protein
MSTYANQPAVQEDVIQTMGFGTNSLNRQQLVKILNYLRPKDELAIRLLCRLPEFTEYLFNCSMLLLLRLQRPAIFATAAEEDDDLQSDAVDFEPGWDWMELIAAGLHSDNVTHSAGRRNLNDIKNVLTELGVLETLSGSENWPTNATDAVTLLQDCQFRPTSCNTWPRQTECCRAFVL